MNAEIRLILTTFGDETAASAVIRTLVEERLIACGSIIPGMKSIYRWKGAVEEASEVQVILKTSAEGATRCIGRLAELHPYEVPEIIRIEPAAVIPSYAGWIRDALSPEA
jgi:periplasmic divalent cation tolerance protein